MNLGFDAWGSLLGVLLCGIALLLLYLPVSSDFLSLLKARRSASEPTPSGSGGLSRLLFLVPAHNEAGHVGNCVESLVHMDYPEESRRVVVIADNCVDSTAEEARAGGSECLVRQDSNLRGKPRAIAWALDQLEDLSEWDACVVIDADTTVRADFARALSQSGPLRNVAAQAYFDVLNPDATWLTRLGKVFATIRYELLFPLKSRAGLNCPLTGNGMCIGIELLVNSGWTAFSLTENWELFAQYTAQGKQIRYVADARLFSDETTSMARGSTQRRRWLAGRLTILYEWLPRLICSNRISTHQKLDAIAELSDPGPVLRGLLSTGTVVACLLLVGGTLGLAMAGAALAALGPLVIMTALSIQRQENPRASLRAFIRLPVYGCWRLLTAIATVKTWRSGHWEKTKRS